ncbi:uncharacterized protein [Atheta coriaria]|uniref:uncharacterized protein isoform X5 n=1 Tax=Dalotia coriaria TaxID=877792 RepID=UPI0031F3FCC9
MNPLDNYLLFTWFAFGFVIFFLWIRSCFYCHHMFHGRAMVPYPPGGQEINTVSRHAELRGQMNELPPDYSKVGGLPPAYDLVVAGNPPAYSEAIQLEINASLAHSHRSTTPATDGAHSTDLTGVVVVPPAVASQQQ